MTVDPYRFDDLQLKEPLKNNKVLNSSNDLVSDRHRKYIIELVEDGKRVFVIWFTDTTSTDKEDAILTDDSLYINGFSSIQSALHFIQGRYPLLPDPQEFLRWSNEFIGNEAYSTYSVDMIKSQILSIDNLESLSKEVALEAIGLFNLINDYSYSTRDTNLNLLFSDPNMKYFFDYVYNNFFWKSSVEQKVVSDKHWKLEVFKILYVKSVDYFSSRIKISND